MPFKFNPFTSKLDVVQDVSGYVPYTGATMTGDITISKVAPTLNMNDGSFISSVGLDGGGIMNIGCWNDIVFKTGDPAQTERLSILQSGGITTGEDIRGKDYIKTRNLALTYTDGNLTRVVKTGGRTIYYTYTAGVLTSYTDGTNTWTLSYTSGNLTSVTVT